MNNNKTKTFSFYINAENYTYSFSLPIFEQEALDSAGKPVKVNNVITSVLRHPEFLGAGKVAAPFLANGHEVREIEDFKKDLNNFVTKLDKKHMLIEYEMLQQVLQQLCEEHIKTYGRLMYVDLLMLIDVFICVDFAIYSGDLDNYHRLYKNEVYRLLDTFPKDIKFINPFGGIYSWADV